MKDTHCPECGQNWKVHNSLVLVVNIFGKQEEFRTKQDTNKYIVDVYNEINNGNFKEVYCGGCGNLNLPVIIENE